MLLFQMKAANVYLNYPYFAVTSSLSFGNNIGNVDVTDQVLTVFSGFQFQTKVEGVMWILKPKVAPFTR